MVDYITWGLLFFGWGIFMFSSISIVAGKVSLLGIYHNVKLGVGRWGFFKCNCNGAKNQDGECFYEKCVAVFKANFTISLLLLPSYLIIISETLGHDSIEFSYLLYFSTILTLVSLITIRLLSNQSKFLILYIVRMPSGKSLEEVAKERSEKTIGHFHTLVCTAWMVIGIYFTACVIKGETVPQLIFDHIQIDSCVYVIVVFLFVMPLLTFLVEYFFLYSPPIIKTQIVEEIKQNNENIVKQIRNPTESDAVPSKS